MRHLLSFLFILSASACLYGQPSELKPAKHGIDLIYDTHTTKEMVISDVIFEDGEDPEVDIVRFDKYAGPGVLPLVISSKMPVQSDEFGLNPGKLHSDSLAMFLAVVHNLNTGIIKRPRFDGWLFRITYRLNGMVRQYYVSNAKDPTGYFRKIEQRLSMINDAGIMERFYSFLGQSEFVDFVNGKPIWRQ
jgi:hypothetical protein